MQFCSITNIILENRMILLLTFGSVILAHVVASPNWCLEMCYLRSSGSENNVNPNN